MKLFWKVPLFLALSLATLATQNLFAQSKSQPAQRWEYKNINCSDTELNQSGEEGWELVSVSTNSGNCYQYLLKRLKPVTAPKYVNPYQPPPKKEDAPTCKLTLEQSPKIRGIRLGMSIDDVLEMFPGSKDRIEVRKELEAAKSIERGGGGFNLKTLNPPADPSFFKQIEQFSVGFFDGRLVTMEVYYSRYSDEGQYITWTTKAWIAKVMVAFNLPAQEYWTSTGYFIAPESQEIYYSLLRCQNFEVHAPNPGNLRVKMLDYEDQIKQRQKEANEKKQQKYKIIP